MNNIVFTNEDYKELLGHVEYLGSKCNQQEEELRYMQDFLRWMHLETMYADFRKNAYEFQPEDGSFSYYTLYDKQRLPETICS